MARNGSGTYSLVAGNPVVTGTTISSTWANNTLTDIATALTGSVAADGQTPITGPLKAANGTAGAPSYSWTASAGTGLYSPATDQAAISAGGSQVMKWAAGATTITGTTTQTGQWTSTLATGTAPLVVTSTTEVANLNVAKAGTLSAVLSGALGGTGIANTGFTITLAGSLVTTGAYTTTHTFPGAYTYTYPGAGNSPGACRQGSHCLRSDRHRQDGCLHPACTAAPGSSVNPQGKGAPDSCSDTDPRTGQSGDRCRA